MPASRNQDKISKTPLSALIHINSTMSSFGPNFVGLTGKPDAIRRVAKAFKVFFQKVPLPGDDYC